MRTSRTGASLIALGIALGLGTMPSPGVRAADHTDGPAASADPAADITDVFAWMSPDASQMNLAMDLVKNANTSSRFSDRVQYVFHLNGKSSFGATSAGEYQIICEFEPSQQIRCWAGRDEFLGGDASSPRAS